MSIFLLTTVSRSDFWALSPYSIVDRLQSVTQVFLFDDLPTRRIGDRPGVVEGVVRIADGPAVRPYPIPTWGRAAANETIPYVNINGYREWAHTWYRHVRPCYLNYRATTRWLPHQVVVWGVGHGDYPSKPAAECDGTWIPRPKIWDYIALYMDQMLTLRLPDKPAKPEAPGRCG